MTTAPLPPENLVDQAVERAAEKVASVTLPAGPVLSRTEGLLIAAVLAILNVAGLFVGLQSWNDTRAHRADFKEVCQLIVERSPQESAAEIGRRLAECLR